MTRLSSFLILVFSISTAAAQTKHFDKFVAVLQTGERLEGQDGTLDDSEFTGISLQGERIRIPVSDLKTLYFSKEKKTVLFALLGGGVGLAVVLSAYSNSRDQDAELSTGTIAGFTLAGALIGGIAGSQIESWDAIQFP